MSGSSSNMSLNLCVTCHTAYCEAALWTGALNENCSIILFISSTMTQQMKMFIGMSNYRLPQMFFNNSSGQKAFLK